MTNPCRLALTAMGLCLALTAAVVQADPDSLDEAAMAQGVALHAAVACAYLNDA